METAVEFFARRAGGSDGSKLLHFLKQAPDRKPDPGDELDLPSRARAKRVRTAN